jgi:ectoine hydroxylase-related dioxygenase (phytanoyl-CoA dioxygenase family)
MAVTINQADIDHWHEHGYVVVENACTKQQVDAALDNINLYMPTWEEYQRRPRAYEPLLGERGIVRRGFPFAGDALNALTFNPYLLEFAWTVLGTADLALSHSGLFGKYAGLGDFEQDLHVDYGNNTLAYPKDDLTVFDLPFIVYYSDVTVDMGPTYVVSQKHTSGELLEPRHRPRDHFAELYEHEEPVTVPAGGALLYSMRTFHRGSRMLASEGVRYSHHLAYHVAGPRWLGSRTFQRDGGSPEMDHFITSATPQQREMVGFPSVGDSYWDDETLAGVGARYPGIDLEPYRAGRSLSQRAQSPQDTLSHVCLKYTRRYAAIALFAVSLAIDAM